MIDPDSELKFSQRGREAGRRECQKGTRDKARWDCSGAADAVPSWQRYHSPLDLQQSSSLTMAEVLKASIIHNENAIGQHDIKPDPVSMPAPMAKSANGHAAEVDAAQVATAWAKSFQSAIDAKDKDGIVGLFHQDGFWRWVVWSAIVSTGTLKLTLCLHCRDIMNIDQTE